MRPHRLGSGRVLALALVGVAGIGIAALDSVTEPLIWNRTESLPLGLYRLAGRPPERGDIVAVSGHSDPARWAAAQGYTGPGWPLLKRVAAREGDTVCRVDHEILIDGRQAAIALDTDSQGRALPVWTGCRTLLIGEVFLLNDHPHSLDGRYFGVTEGSDLIGVAVPILTVED